MDKVLTLKDTINLGKHKKILVSDIVNIKGEVFKYIKEGYQFDDEVLEKAHIKKRVSNEKVITSFVTLPKHKFKEYPKETESVKNILKTINTLDGQITEDVFNHDDDDSITIIDED